MEEANKSNVKTYLISPDDWMYKYNYKSFKKKNTISNPILLLDVHEYSKGNVHKRMKKFIGTFCKDCNDVAGFPSCILFDSNNSIIYKSLINEKKVGSFIRALSN